MVILKSILFLLAAGCLSNQFQIQAHLLPIVDPNYGANSTTIQTYIVHVYEPDHADDLLGPEDRVNWYMSFLPNTTLDSGEPRLLHSYHHVISGFAARLTPNEVNDMESLDGFAAAYPDQTHQLHTTYTPQFLELNQWESSIWQKSNYGEGVIIGVLDSGITRDHPSFSDDGMSDPPVRWRGCCVFNVTRCSKWVPSTCNKKLLGARPAGFEFDAIDATGHGTHTASTAAGNYVPGANVLDQAKGTAVGIAPRAHLSIYKVCGAKTCSDYNILTALDFAMEDGVDVLSIALGFAKSAFDENSIIKGTFAAMEQKGIITSACVGNGGSTENAVENDAPWILTVGASSVDRVVRATVKLGNGMELDGESAYQPHNSRLPMMEIVYPGVVDTHKKRVCEKGALDDMNVTGKIVLCGVGSDANTEKGEIVKAAGGAALIVLNQPWNGFTTKSEPHVIPTVHVSFADTLKILSYFNTQKNNAKATIIFKGTMFGARQAPAVASFSSRGPSLINGGIIKPDIVGPGVNILAAWHKDVGPGASGKSSTSAFNFNSGCSMATPHLAGVAALLKSEHPDWSPAAIKSAVMTTAHTLDRNGDPIKDEKSDTLGKASHFAMGAGHVNPSKARDPGLVYDNDADDYIGYLCSLRFSTGQIFSITRRKVDCRDVKKVSAGELNYPSILVSLQSSDTKTINRTVTNVGEASSSYSVQTNAPQGTSVVVTPTKLQFSRTKEKKSFSVTISKKKGNTPMRGKYSEGDLTWVSSNRKRFVRSPIAVQF